jgi:hypothetical protein
MNEDTIPNEKLWTKDITKRYKDGTHWSLLRTKEDRRTRERYFDVLVGLRARARKYLPKYL